MPGTTLNSITTFGDLLKHLRRRARLTQRDLGIAVGYSDAHVARLEGGQRQPDVTTVRTLLVPALELQDEPALAARLIELAEATRSENRPAPEPIPPLSAPRSPRLTNLPAPLTRLIGRQGELAEIGELLTTTRLLTIIGSAGAGKTRLAIEAGARFTQAHGADFETAEVRAGHAVSFPDGVWLVELAPVTNAAQVADAVAAACRLSQAAGTVVEALIDHLLDKSLLLILDNCEHLIVACAELAELLLRRCPQLRILATSREALNIPGEIAWRIPSLARDDAVQVFAERARAAKPGFSLTDQNTPSIAQICERLDGLPLAIELAAARMQALSVEQIAERLGDRFGLLTSGARTALPRHQTLRTLIDWSYDLLTDAERCLLQRLAVFSNGWTLETAEAVCADEASNSPPPAPRIAISPAQVLPLLFDLVRKSLVIVDERVDVTRYRLLYTVREYGLEKLSEQNELDALCRRHACAYLALAEQAEQQLNSGRQSQWSSRLTQERDNLNAALAWSRQPCGEASIGLRLAACLWQFWHWYGNVREGRQWLAELLRELPADTEPATCAILLMGASALELAEGERYTQINEQTASRLEQALRIFQGLDHPQGMAITLTLQGILAGNRNDLSRARALLDQGLAVSRRLGRTWVAGWPLVHLGDLAVAQNDWTRATACYEECLAIQRKSENSRGMSGALLGLGLVALRKLDCPRALEMSQLGLQAARQAGYSRADTLALMQIGEACRYMGKLEQARAAFEELYNRSMAVDDAYGTGFALQLIAKIERDEGNCQQARAHFVESLGYRDTLGVWSVPFNLEGLASIAVAQGQAARAVRLYGAAEHIRETAHWPLASDNLPEYGRMQGAIREQLGPSARAAAFAEGAAMTLEQAVEYAMSMN